MLTTAGDDQDQKDELEALGPLLGSFGTSHLPGFWDFSSPLSIGSLVVPSWDDLIGV